MTIEARQPPSTHNCGGCGEELSFRAGGPTHWECINYECALYGQPQVEMTEADREFAADAERGLKAALFDEAPFDPEHDDFTALGHQLRQAGL